MNFLGSLQEAERLGVLIGASLAVAVVTFTTVMVQVRKLLKELREVRPQLESVGRRAGALERIGRIIMARTPDPSAVPPELPPERPTNPGFKR